MTRISVGVVGPDLGQVTREFGVVGTDERFSLAMVQNKWGPFLESLQEGEPELIVVYADVAPGPDALVEILSRLKRAVAIVLLPPGWAELQGTLENVHTVRKVYVLPVTPAEVLKIGYNAVQTEKAKSQSIAPLQQIYTGGGRSAAAVGTRVIAFVSAQGGTGCSTIAESLGFELAARRNIRTLLFSFNLPPSAPLRLNLHNQPNAGEFFARPGAASFKEVTQTSVDGLDVIVAPPESYAYAQAAEPSSDEEGSIRSLVITAYACNYGAILLDLPSGESDWAVQPLLAANTVIIVSRPTLEGIKATAHVAKLLTEKFEASHKIPREGIYLVLNQRTKKSTYTASSFHQLGAKKYGWFPPVMATIDFDPVIPQAQDHQRPVASVSDVMGKAIIGLADTFYGNAHEFSGNQRGKAIKLFGVRIRTGV